MQVRICRRCRCYKPEDLGDSYDAKAIHNCCYNCFIDLPEVSEWPICSQKVNAELAAMMKRREAYWPRSINKMFGYRRFKKLRSSGTAMHELTAVGGANTITRVRSEHGYGWR